MPSGVGTPGSGDALLDCTHGIWCIMSWIAEWMNLLNGQLEVTTQQQMSSPHKWDVVSYMPNFFGQWWASPMSGGHRLRCHMWAMGNSRVLEENRVGHDTKAIVPKQEPRRLLFRALKSAPKSAGMALQKCGAWTLLHCETVAEKSNARNRAAHPSFCRGTARGEAVSCLRFQQRGL